MARGTKRGHSVTDDEAPDTNGHNPASSETTRSRPTPEPAPPSAIVKIRNSLDEHFVQITDLWFSIARPPPTETGDGSYTKTKEDDSFIKKITSLKPSDIKTLIDLADDTIFNKPWDDREYLLERIVQTTSKLPPHSKLQKRLTNALVTALYNDLQHPPISYLGKSENFRNADGSNNGHNVRAIGAADQPYARTVPPSKPQPSARPDPGDIFDSIFKRHGPDPHPNKISSMLFYLATVIIHDLFRTSHSDSSISQTSSYLDLSPLYGSNLTEQNAMRTFRDGKLKPDCFSEKRILGFPPGVGALLIMFNRFHNHVVENLAEINEAGRFNKPKGSLNNPLHHHQWADYDEQLFQTARLITCGLYINTILIDYVRVILNLNRTDSDWKLDPRVDIPGGPPRGTGNQVSAEFNLIYRWHSTISYRDERWIEDNYKQMFQGRDPSTVSIPELIDMLSKMEQDLDDDPIKRPFHGLQREKNKNFEDDDLVKILTESIEDCANSFGANRVPAVLRAVEIMGIKQARKWSMATLNEFRAHFQLKTYDTFEEINPHIADELRHLYDKPDNVELYPGLVCEDAKEPKLPGAGLTPGFTTSRAVLSDAVALVRGDRFYTTDYTPAALTNWGYAEASSNPAFDHGCVFYKLFNTAFPEHFKFNSIYAHYPLTVPEENRVIMEGLGKEKLYDFNPPQRKPKVRTVSTYDGAMAVMHDKHTYGVEWGPAMTFLMGPPALSFMLAYDGPPNVTSRQMMEKAMYPRPSSHGTWDADVKAFYKAKTRELLLDKSYRLTSTGNRRVDLVRDVTNLVHVHFCAQIFCLPLKTNEHPHGIFSEQQLYLILAAVFVCVFFDADPVHSYEIHEMAFQACQKLGQIVEDNVRSIKATGWLSNVMEYFYRDKELTKLEMFGVSTIRNLLKSETDVHELVWGHILGTAGGMVPNQGQLFSEMLDFYLNDPLGQKHWPAVVEEACADDTPESDERLKRYMLEGSRLSCGSAVVRKVRRDVQLRDGASTLDLTEDERVFVNLYAASRDPAVFPDPLEIRLDRRIEDYVQLGHGPHKCLGFGLAMASLTAMLRVVASLRNLRPLLGDQGRIKKVPAGEALPGYNKYVVEDDSGAHYFPFPMSMKVEWDDEEDSFEPMRRETLERRKTLPLLNGDGEEQGLSEDKAAQNDTDDRSKKPGRRSGAGERHGHGHADGSKRQRR